MKRQSMKRKNPLKKVEELQRERKGPRKKGKPGPQGFHQASLGAPEDQVKENFICTECACIISPEEETETRDGSSTPSISQVTEQEGEHQEEEDISELKAGEIYRWPCLILPTCYKKNNFFLTPNPSESINFYFEENDNNDIWPNSNKIVEFIICHNWDTTHLQSAKLFQKYLTLLFRSEANIPSEPIDIAEYEDVDVYEYKTRNKVMIKALNFVNEASYKLILKMLISKKDKKDIYFRVKDFVVRLNPENLYIEPCGRTDEGKTWQWKYKHLTYDRLNIASGRNFSQALNELVRGDFYKRQDRCSNVNIQDAVAMIAVLISEAIRNPSTYYINLIMMRWNLTWEEFKDYHPMLQGGSWKNQKTYFNSGENIDEEFDPPDKVSQRFLTIINKYMEAYKHLHSYECREEPVTIVRRSSGERSGSNEGGGETESEGSWWDLAEGQDAPTPLTPAGTEPGSCSRAVDGEAGGLQEEVLGARLTVHTVRKRGSV